jgi:23S rRNA (cytosine1962-C5)-methyltransferase
MRVMAEAPVVVTPKGEARIRRGHPWIFKSDVRRSEGAAPGALVRVLGPEGRPLGWALHSSRSEIKLRMVERGEALPADFLRARIAAALRFREEIAPGVTALRLVHGEGDGLPSLIVDRYGDFLVVQTLSQGMEARKDEVVRLLVELLAPRGILERNDPRVRALEGLEQRVGLLHGAVPDTVEVDQGGLRLSVDLWRGQKTGLFLDQRENHAMTESYARGRVLDVFTYHGAFALHAARAATSVLATDVSEDALAHVAKDAARNGITNVTTREANAFDLLKALDLSGERFDTVVLDPPAFAKSKDAIEKAGRGYKEINLRALKLLRPGGILITCSCSYHIHESDFEDILEQAAADANATVTIVEKRRQGRDHPVLLGVPETYYLKCFVLRKAS